MSQKKKTTAQSKRPRKAPSNQTGGTAWGKKAAAAISGKMQSADVKKLILLNFPYIIAFYMVEKAAWLYRHCNGDTIVDRLMVLFMNFGLAYKSYLPSVHPFDLLVGLIGAAALKAVIYFKGKNAKKYRQGEEYGSARWGNAKDIEPFIDPVFENNVLLTQTERLMMSGRPKHPKYARNKNVIVIGGSGSGKTRFFVKPNLMQMPEKVSYVCTDPKGTIIIECGKMLSDAGYKIKVLNTINFKKSIEKRNVNCIIVKDLSRFGRNYIETGRYLERIFPFMGVRFIAINDHYDSAEENDDKGRILIPFNNLINDTYCRDISLRVRSHLDVKRKEGQFIGSFAGYGYRKDPKDKNHLIIDEYAAGIVQEIFKQKLNGMSSQRIASHLNELGVLPPNEYKRANGFNYTCGFQAGLNQKWTVVSVNRILKNESYTGTLIQGKRRKINYKVKKSHDVGSENWIRVEDAHDAIISKGEFQQVQQLLELDTRTAPSQTTVYPLSGFLRCADCGQNMIRRTVTKNGKKYQYYHCSTYKNGGGCTPHMINSEKLTESVLAAIRHQVTLLVEAEKVLSNAELASGEQIGIKILDSQITALEAELERYSNLKIRLYQDLCDDVVSREEYGEMNTRFAQKIKEAQDKIQEIREKKQEALKHNTLLPTWLEEFKQYEHIKTLERRVVVELIDHIDVHSKTEIEIHFCFEDELHSITEKFMEYQAHHGNEVAEE